VRDHFIWLLGISFEMVEDFFETQRHLSSRQVFFEVFSTFFRLINTV
jgi:hypothetical protein